MRQNHVYVCGARKAAASAGVHRDTVAYWRRTCSGFRQALAGAVAEKALYWREQAEQLAAPALEALRAIVTDPATPAGVRLKAALAILNKAAAPAAEPNGPGDSPDPPVAAPPPHPDPDPESSHFQIVHKNAQSHPRAIDSLPRNIARRDAPRPTKLALFVEKT